MDHYEDIFGEHEPSTMFGELSMWIAKSLLTYTKYTESADKTTNKTFSVHAATNEPDKP